MRKSKTNSKNISTDIPELCYDEEVEENGICNHLPTGRAVAVFSFNNDTMPADKVIIKEQPVDIAKPVTQLDIIDTRTLRPQAFGKTPSINGEAFERSRTFMFRISTIRVLNKIKAEDPDENIYLSSIIDNAILHYANYIINKTI